MNLGQSWAAKVPADTANRATLAASAAEREQQASAWVDCARSDLLPSGIASCVSRASDSLGLPLPGHIALTATMQDFIGELARDGLMASISQVDDAFLLLVTPAA